MSRLEIYWSFRSPYSYLACDRLQQIKRDYDLDTEFRPVRPLALREPSFFTKGRKQVVPYLLRDVFREAEQLNVTLVWPKPDPITMNLATRVAEPEQPIMDRLMSLGIAACEAGAGLEFAYAVAKRIWCGDEGWFTEETLAAAATEVGLELATLDAWAGEHEGKVAETIAANEAAQLEHHWGVPLMVLDGEPFFGQDRLDALIWRLNGLGLRSD